MAPSYVSCSVVTKQYGLLSLTKLSTRFSGVVQVNRLIVFFAPKSSLSILDPFQELKSRVLINTAPSPSYLYFFTLNFLFSFTFFFKYAFFYGVALVSICPIVSTGYTADSGLLWFPH